LLCVDDAHRDSSGDYKQRERERRTKKDEEPRQYINTSAKDSVPPPGGHVQAPARFVVCTMLWLQPRTVQYVSVMLNDSFSASVSVYMKICIYDTIPYP